MGPEMHTHYRHVLDQMAGQPSGHAEAIELKLSVGSDKHICFRVPEI